jgi:hypothetical protein
MKGLNESKYSLQEVYEKQNPSPSVQRLLEEFHHQLVQRLDENNLHWMARTHIAGISYLCNDRKAFLFLDVRQQFITTHFFTGKSSIAGIGKRNWLHLEDNLGSQPHRIVDKTSLDRALSFAVEAYHIASEWTGLK